MAPNTIYSISTTTGQQKGSYTAPAASAFPFPYYENYEHYNSDFTTTGYRPYYHADISGGFELYNRPDGMEVSATGRESKGQRLGRRVESLYHRREPDLDRLRCQRGRLPELQTGWAWVWVASIRLETATRRLPAGTI